MRSVGRSLLSYAAGMAHHLVSTVEIAGMLGVTRQRVQQLVASDDFPRPEIELGIGKVWSREAVETWIRLRPEKKGGRPKKRS